MVEFKIRCWNDFVKSKFFGSNLCASSRRGWETRLASFSETQTGVKSRGMREEQREIPSRVMSGERPKPVSSLGAIPWVAEPRAPEPSPAARSDAPAAVAELRSCDSAEDGRRSFLLSLGKVARISPAGAVPLGRLLAISPRISVAETHDLPALSRQRWVVERAECFRSCTRWDVERKDSLARADCSRGPRVLRHYSFAPEVRRPVRLILRLVKLLPHSRLGEPRGWRPEPAD